MTPEQEQIAREIAADAADGMTDGRALTKDLLAEIDSLRTKLALAEQQLSLLRLGRNEELAECQRENETLRAELAELQGRFVDIVLECALYNTADARKRLKESEFIPADLWEMRLK